VEIIYRYQKMIKVLKANEKFLDKTYGEWGAEW
jgi:hypothetical protein